MRAMSSRGSFFWHKVSGRLPSEIASRWGFSHLGRFAVEYRLRFGEDPSETLAQACSLGLNRKT